jgi:hypothetical protein
MSQRANTNVNKLFTIRVLGTFFPSVRRSDKMPKASAAFVNDEKQQASLPQISDTPTITSSGNLAWNVRDILFGPNRSAGAGNSDRRTNMSKSSAKE